MSQENSTRVFGDKGWTMEPPLRCAAHVQPPAALNNPKLAVLWLAALGSLWEFLGKSSFPLKGDIEEVWVEI